MSIIDTHELILPTNPDDVKRLSALMTDISNVMQIIADKQSYIKDVKKELKEEFGQEFVKQYMRSATLYHKGTYDEQVIDSTNLQSTYETLAPDAP